MNMLNFTNFNIFCDHRTLTKTRNLGLILLGNYRPIHMFLITSLMIWGSPDGIQNHILLLVFISPKFTQSGGSLAFLLSFRTLTFLESTIYHLQNLFQSYFLVTKFRYAFLKKNATVGMICLLTTSSWGTWCSYGKGGFESSHQAFPHRHQPTHVTTPPVLKLEN